MFEGTYFLSLYHWMVGKGTPSTLHSRLISCVTVVEMSWTELEPAMVGGTAARSERIIWANWVYEQSQGSFYNYVKSEMNRFVHSSTKRQTLTSWTHPTHLGRSPSLSCQRCWWLYSCSRLHLQWLPSVASGFFPYQGSGCCYWQPPASQHAFLINNKQGREMY